MKHALAEELFGVVMELSAGRTDELVRLIRPLRHMSNYKFDSYGGYGASIKFLETLSIWLNQFNKDERELALKFVLNDLVFLSDREIQHALSLAYQDLVRPELARRAAAELGIAPWRIAKILASVEFRTLQRRTMFMGLADGARLDQFRRANPALVHDQFSVTAEPPARVARGMRDDLAEWLRRTAPSVEPTFCHFVLVDDFSGSGYTALRQGPDGAWSGKLHHVKHALDQLVAADMAAPEYTVDVVLYTASETAQDALCGQLANAGLDNWSLSVVQIIPSTHLVDPSSAFAELCRRHHDPIVDDKVKTDAASNTAALGFRDSRLPLVLSHNTPNNSVGVLWENTAEDPRSSKGFTPLFPRHERHKADR